MDRKSIFLLVAMLTICYSFAEKPCFWTDTSIYVHLVTNTTNTCITVKCKKTPSPRYDYQCDKFYYDTNRTLHAEIFLVRQDSKSKCDFHIIYPEKSLTYTTEIPNDKVRVYHLYIKTKYFCSFCATLNKDDDPEALRKDCENNSMKLNFVPVAQNCD